MARKVVTISKERVTGAFTNVRQALDATNDHEFQPTKLQNCVLVVTNTTDAQKVATIVHADGGDDIELTLAAGDGTEQIAVYDFKDAVNSDWLHTGKVRVDIAADMTGFISVFERLDPVTINVERGTGAAGATVELSTLDGTYGVFTPNSLGRCMLLVKNALDATTTPSGQNDKKLQVKPGDAGVARGIGDTIVNCKENSNTQIVGLDSSRHTNEDGTVRIRPQEGINGTVTIMEE